MTTIYRDDITGEEYETDEHFEEFGIIANGMAFFTFETATPVVDDDPDVVAERLHEMVDEWANDRRKHLEEQAEDEGFTSVRELLEERADE